jgi:hypothetical protein
MNPIDIPDRPTDPPEYDDEACCNCDGPIPLGSKYVAFCSEKCYKEMSDSRLTSLAGLLKDIAEGK